MGEKVSTDTQWEVRMKPEMFCCEGFESQDEFMPNGETLAGVSGQLLSDDASVCDLYARHSNWLNLVGCSQPTNH